MTKNEFILMTVSNAIANGNRSDFAHEGALKFAKENPGYFHIANEIPESEATLWEVVPYKKDFVLSLEGRYDASAIDFIKALSKSLLYSSPKGLKSFISSAFPNANDVKIEYTGKYLLIRFNYKLKPFGICFVKCSGKRATEILELK